MKKIVLLSLAFATVVALLFSSQTTLHAQGAPGSFTCRMISGSCQVASDNCNVAGGFAPDHNVCTLLGLTGAGGALCNASGPSTCMKATGAIVDIQGTCATNSISTAIGCIPIGDLGSFASFFLKWGLGFAGGIATLLLIYSSFLIMTSAGDPKRLQTGQELLFSVVSGIILLVFSMFILQILGVKVLGII